MRTQSLTMTNKMPGMAGLMLQFAATGALMEQLAENLLRTEGGPGTLTMFERNLIFASVSKENNCEYDTKLHMALAKVHYAGNEGANSVIDEVTNERKYDNIDPKIVALLSLAHCVAHSNDTTSDIERSRTNGATDQEIHDTVLIASYACMSNRYVDGLNTAMPEDEAYYKESAERIKENGYMALTAEKLEEAAHQ